MELKSYQKAALDTLRDFLTKAAAIGPDRAFVDAVAAQDDLARLEGRPVLPRAYKPLDAMPNVPYVCLRLPTGGGKTTLAAKAIGIAGDFARVPHPLTLWMVPSDTIKSQTLEALKNTRHPYRQRLNSVFGGRVRIFDVSEFETIRPQDIARSVCVVVATIQAFRVEKTSGRKICSQKNILTKYRTVLSIASAFPTLRWRPSKSKSHVTELALENAEEMLDLGANHGDDPVGLLVDFVELAASRCLLHYAPDLAVLDECSVPLGADIALFGPDQGLISVEQFVPYAASMHLGCRPCKQPQPGIQVIRLCHPGRRQHTQKPTPSSMCLAGIRAPDLPDEPHCL